jgi:hypothetical protein
LVAEWITISAPSARAFWLRGVANVPSMHTRAPFSWQSFDTRSISTHLKKGLVGDSVKKSATLFSSNADSRPPMSAGSITVAVIPILGRIVSINMRVFL